MPGTATRSERWLFGPLPDLVLGCGLGYSVLFLLQALDGEGMRSWLPQGLAPLFALVTATPHYGATLLRVYERPEDRSRYRIFTVYASLVVAGLFLAGLVSPLVGSVILTVYLTWSPWHYTGQNYGLAVMFLRRRGVTVSPEAKRLLYASFFLSFVLTFLAVHAASYSGGSYGPEAYRATSGGLVGPVYQFLPLGIPGAVTGPLLGLLFGAYLVTLGGAAVLLLRTGRARDLLPSALLVGTQSLWFSVPVITQYWGLLTGVEPLRVEFSKYAFLWVVVGHSVQYLWVTAYFAKRQSPFAGGGRWFAQCVGCGAAIWGVPALVFGAQGLGGPEYSGGLHLLIASCVNIHHFLLDGAIWKLRDGRIARVLIRPSESGMEGVPATGARRLGWERPLVWTAGAACAVVVLVSTLETEYGWSRALARGDGARVALAAERLRSVRRASSQIDIDLGALAAERGEFARALDYLDRSIAVRPMPKAFYLRGLIFERRGELPQAIESFEAAQALTPDRPEIREALARVRAASDRAQAGGADRS